MLYRRITQQIKGSSHLRVRAKYYASAAHFERRYGALFILEDFYAANFTDFNTKRSEYIGLRRPDD